MTGKTQDTEIKLSGNLFENSVFGSWKYLINNVTDTLYNFEGIITLEDELFTFAKHSKRKNDFLFSFQLSDIFTAPQINYGYIENIPFHLLTSRKWIKSILKDFSFEGILVGPFNALNSELKFSSKSSPGSELIGQCC